MKPEAVLRDFQIDNCRVCFDIKDWKEKARKAAFEESSSNQSNSSSKSSGAAASVVFSSAIATGSTDNDNEIPDSYKACPPDALELGRSTWTFLHTMSVYYPKDPTVKQQHDMSSFLQLFSQFYPCTYCAKHLQEEMKKDPPKVDSRIGLARWLCRMHNEVNERLGNPIFDCEKVEERWRTGPPDGSC